MPFIPNLSAADLRGLITRPEAANAIRDALVAGLDPGADVPRSVVDVASGQLLLMPAESPTAVGVKAVTVAPANAELGLPRVHGLYLLFRAATLELAAVMDGAEISTIRTPAVAMAAVAPALTRFARPVQVLVFGAGPQAVGFVEALAEGVVPIESITYVVRQPERARAALAPGSSVMAAGDPAAVQRLRAADIVVCVTSSTTPVFDSRHIADGAIVLAIGAHEATGREVDGELMARSTVLVEHVPTALREGGDVVLAVAEGKLRPGDIVPMAAVLRGEQALDPARTLVFKSVGMSWEDLVVAEAIMRLHDAAFGGDV